MSNLFTLLRFRSIPHIIPFRKPLLQKIKDLFIPPLFKKEDEWQINAIADFAKMNDISFQESLCFLLECELNERGFLRGDYEPVYRKPVEEEKQKEAEGKILPFKIPKGFKSKPYFGKYKLDFIWDHLPANHNREPTEAEKIWTELCKERGYL